MLDLNQGQSLQRKMGDKDAYNMYHVDLFIAPFVEFLKIRMLFVLHPPASSFLLLYPTCIHNHGSVLLMFQRWQRDGRLGQHLSGAYLIVLLVQSKMMCQVLFPVLLGVPQTF